MAASGSDFYIPLFLRYNRRKIVTILSVSFCRSQTGGIILSEKDFFDSELFQELTQDIEAESRFTATYRLTASTYDEAKEKAFAIAVEQTVECPYELVKDSWIGEKLVGRIEDLKLAAPEVFYATISYSPDAVEGEFAELLNMLYGNVSLYPGVRLMSFELSDGMYSLYKGPKLGRSGIRQLCGIPKGPILMSAIKPMGTSATDLASMVRALALGGCPIIKDDHSLYDQAYAPFRDRVTACVDAVHEANAKTGRKSLYIANASGDGLSFIDRAYTAQELGADGIMAAPGLIGFPIIRQLAEAADFHLPIFLHPCFSGCATMHEDSGISPYCYYGELSRLAGADAVIFTSFGGRFGRSEDECRRIAASTAADMGPLKSIFPVPSGGMKWQLFPRMCRVYDEDTLFLVGGALQTEGPDLESNTKFFMEKLQKAWEGR